jgi:hypothetical protein
MNDKKKHRRRCFLHRCAQKIMVFRRITRIIEVVLNERAVFHHPRKTPETLDKGRRILYICDRVVEELTSQQETRILIVLSF